MPRRVGGKTFFEREEWERIHGKKLPPVPTPEEQAARRAEWEAAIAAAPEPPAGVPDYRSSKNYFDDLIGTEFEGWTMDPDTREWRDARGRPAYDAQGQRIRYDAPEPRGHQ
ncbi:hypothetical protein KO481_32135 [Nocardia sp. NEAU-G5]|uniref:Uncharacterized protein n=1 Tax=Nocardia albiluteola TaxID=2842303 RepID=A0ABS6B768_9NOCA|nr:hypothetical protein [Nocardia albiluteola]MBU3066154.1 hypothetical protein [Nocardia albiluteola]